MSPLSSGRMVHAVARAALRLARPLIAKRIVDRVAQRVARQVERDVACMIAGALEPHGTCLSRALAVAALLPGAEVVIGVEPGASSRLFAHAWVEHSGRALRPTDIMGVEIARLSRDDTPSVKA